MQLAQVVMNDMGDNSQHGNTKYPNWSQNLLPMGYALKAILGGARMADVLYYIGLIFNFTWTYEEGN